MWPFTKKKKKVKKAKKQKRRYPRQDGEHNFEIRVGNEYFLSPLYFIEPIL